MILKLDAESSKNQLFEMGCLICSVAMVTELVARLRTERSGVMTNITICGGFDRLNHRGNYIRQLFLFNEN